jgi:hypothetical protein
VRTSYVRMVVTGYVAIRAGLESRGSGVRRRRVRWQA